MTEIHYFCVIPDKSYLFLLSFAVKVQHISFLEECKNTEMSVACTLSIV